MTTASAVDTNGKFELDGNAVDAAGTAGDDWNSVFNITAPYPKTPVAGAGEVFIQDIGGPGGKEVSDFSGSNKDIDEINTWEYDTAKVTPDKDNITDAYSKAYAVTVGPDTHSTSSHSHLVLYFGADRFANNGDAALGFWFFRNAVGLDGDGGFTGTHAIGDILVQVDFVSGGRSSEVQIFEWVGSGGSHGPLNELRFAASNGFTVCTTDDAACVITNNTATASPWAYTPKSGAANTFPAESFFEAGIDITQLIGNVCFSSFMAETRSSHSETAELKDFALGDFDLCSIDVEKTCVVQAGVSPVVDADKETFQTKHQVRIENTGFGPIYDVQLRDDKVAAGTDDCAISSITGGTGAPTTFPILFPNNTTFLDVASQLDPGAANAMTVNMICVTNDNPFQNGVSVRSKATPGGTADVTDTDTETSTEANVCALTLSAGLTVTKYCHGDPNRPGYQTGDLSVVLDPTNGYKPKVCVDIKLSSDTSDQRMVISSFTDSDLGNLIPAGGLTLAPKGLTGDSYTVSSCYLPTAPDSNQTNPGLAEYSDTVSAAGTGKIDGASASAGPVTATCKLCPTCPTCPPPTSN